MVHKLAKFDTVKAPEEQISLENVSREANREKTTRKLKHIDVEAILEAILVSSWGTWEVFGGPFWASVDQLEPTGNDLEPSWSQLEAT